MEVDRYAQGGIERAALVELDPHALPSESTAMSELSIRIRVMTGAEQAMIHSPVRLDKPLSRAIYLCVSSVVPG